MIETFNNYELLRMNETGDPLTMSCVKFESRLYTRESEEEEKKREAGGGGRWYRTRDSTREMHLFYMNRS